MRALRRSGDPHRTVKIRYRWYGPDDKAPMIGQLLASERGRGAYRILRVDNRGGRVDAQTSEVHALLVLTVERAPRSEMEIPGAVTNWLVWDKRVKRVSVLSLGSAVGGDRPRGCS